MKRKVILILIGLVVLVLAIFSGQWLTAEDGDQEDEITERAVPVRILEVRHRSIPISIELSGRLRPEENVEVFSEVSGVLLATNPPFREGNVFRRGQVYIRVDDREERQSLIAQRAEFISSLTQVLPDLRLDFPDAYPSWRSYVEAFDPEERMGELPEPQSGQERYFLSGRNIFTQYHNIRQMEVRASKYQMRAPFDGTVTQSNIDVGTLVREGQSLGSFAKLDAYELVANTRIEDLQHIGEGDKVTLYSTAVPGEWEGEVVRISRTVDPATQMVNAFIRLSGESLKEGMYLRGQVGAGEMDSALTLHRDVVLENDEVFIIQDSVARLHPVNLRHIMQDSVVVTGLEEGMLLINESRNPNFEGTKVREDS